MLHKNPFQKLPELPSHIVYYTPRPVFHPIDPNCIILSTENYGINGGIYKYHLEDNEITCLANYNEIESMRDKYLDDHTQFLDSINNKLHICGGEETIFITYEINTGIIKVGENNDDYNDVLAHCGPGAEIVHIKSSTKNEIHITNSIAHVKYDYIKRYLTIFRDVHFGFEFLKLSYNPLKKQLMVLGGEDSDTIWTCDLETQVKWKLNTELKMPHCVNLFEHDVLFVGDIMFVFYVQITIFSKYNDIWLLDLLNSTWYKSTYNVPECLGHSWYVMKSINNIYIHILDFENGIHFKVNFNDLLSMEFINARRDYYNLLVIGYIKQQEKSKLISNVPFVLKQLILNYFPVVDEKR